MCNIIETAAEEEGGAGEKDRKEGRKKKEACFMRKEGWMVHHNIFQRRDYNMPGLEWPISTECTRLSQC